MSTKFGPKAGIYFSHNECFGHTSRVIAVGEIFKKRLPQGSLFFIHAGVDQPNSNIEQFGQVYSLPGVLMDRRNFREAQCPHEADSAKRTKLCLNIVTKQRPQLFITEFFPLGRDECRHELIPSLIKASGQGSCLWAVAGYPLLTGKNNEWRQKILKLYQRIIIFSPSHEKDHIADSFTRKQDRQDYLDFFKRHAPKIYFAGYLLPRQKVVRADQDDELDTPPLDQGACRVAVLRGGGAVYPKLIAQAIRTSELLGPEFYFSVVAGPSTTQEEWDLFTALAAKKKINNLALFRAVGDYERIIEESDVCVSLASYHTSVMLLKHRKKTVIIPFEGYGAKTIQEQPSRAVMLKELIGAKILSINNLTAMSLSATIKEAAGTRIDKAPIPKKWFKGGDVLDEALIGLFGR